jgi:hypothetical protein
MSLILLSSGTTSTPIIPAIGPDVAATLVLQLETGAKVTYGWMTDVMKSWNGKEQRVSLLSSPKQKFSGVALLVDGEDRSVRAQLVAAAQTGAAFLLGLPYEELTLTAASSGAVVTVTAADLTLCDWALPGQRVLVMDLDNTTTSAVVQSTTATTITLDVAPGAKAGARIMPATAVYLDAQQGLGRHIVNMTEWHLSATGAEFGYGGVDGMGTNTATSYAGLLVWNRRDIDDVAEDSMQALTEIVDLGGLPIGVGSASTPDWGRQVRYRGSDQPSWQWLKWMIGQTRGRAKSFLLPTWRPDMLFVSSGVGTLLVKSSSVSGAGNVIAWLTSTSTRYVQALDVSGNIDYLTISSWGDNLDGTVTLNVDHTLALTPVMLSWLERVRWESDDLAVTWIDATPFEFVELTRVVQQ